MENKRNADNRSPWPACADCQGGTEEHGTTSEAAACPARAKHDVAGETSCDGLELGPRRDAVRQAAEEAFARAMARAKDREKKAEQAEEERTK